MGNKAKFLRATAFGQGSRKLVKAGRVKDYKEGVALLMEIHNETVEIREANRKAAEKEEQR